MVDFKKVKDRKVASPRLVVTIQLELTDSTLTMEEVDQRIHRMVYGHQSRGWSGFIVDLIRDTGSSMWELLKYDVTDGRETPDRNT